jgi:CHAT domain-containing protein
LLEPALRNLPAGITRLVIVPDDVLHRVPFDALILDGGRPAIERFSISVAPSASIVAHLWGLARAPAARPPALLLADPTFAEIVPRRNDRDVESIASVFAAAGGLRRLPYSSEEARGVARVMTNATLRLRDQASEAFLRSAPLRGYRAIHFATHAVVDERSPTRTAMALAPGNGHDGFLGPGDLAALDLDADLVVLSACRTASGVVVRGEGVLGLTSPLLQAGARAVVASGWRVDDRAASGLVTSFYRALGRGLPAGDALREAKLAALRRRAPLSEWAAFTIIGDPLVRLFPTLDR